MWFESSVNSDGTQTIPFVDFVVYLFESSVNSDGTQTYILTFKPLFAFESSVNSDGTQTNDGTDTESVGLRAV